jgi:lysine decarboxylase
MNGTEADHILRSRYNIQVEMSDLYNIVAITTIGDEQEDYEKFVYALKDMTKEANISHSIETNPSTYDKIPKTALMPWEAVYREKETKNLKDSVGRICGEMIIPYPPGIPLIMPGEVITGEVLEYARLCVERGIKINGASDSKLRSIRVIK